MSIPRNFEVAASLFDFLEVNELFRCAMAGTAFCDIVSRYLAYHRIPSKVVRGEPTKDLNSVVGRLRLAKSIYNRRIVYFSSPKTLESFRDCVSVHVKIDFPSGTIIEDCKVLQNNFFVKTFPNTLHHCSLRAVQTKESSISISAARTLAKLEDILKFDMCANTLFVLTADKKVLMRFWGPNPSGSGFLDEPAEFLPSLKIFGETDYRIYKIFMNEQYLVFITNRFQIYLIDASSVSSMADWQSQSYNIYRIQASEAVRSVQVTSQYVLLLEKESNRVWDLRLDKSGFVEMMARYAQEERNEFLTLHANLGEMSPVQTTGNVASHHNLLMLEVNTTPTQMSSLDKRGVTEMFHKIGLTDFDKVIQHNNIGGRELMNFNEKNIKDIFGIREKSHSIVKIMDQIAVQKAMSRLPPHLFLLGANYNGLFGKDGTIGTYCEIPAPTFDLNEEITAAEIGSHNVVLKTNRSRCFISIKRDLPEDPKRKKSSFLKESEDPVVLEERNNDKAKGKKNKKPKFDRAKKDNEKQKSRPQPRDKTEWVCLEDLFEKYFSQHFGADDYLYKIQGSAGYFNTVVAPNPGVRLQLFETAGSFLSFLKQNKLFDPDNILFCAQSINKYYIYDEILASPKLLSDIRIIKRKSDHLALWSKYHPYFDVRQNLL